MAAFTANQVTVNNGQKNIVINSSETPDGVRKGDFIGIASFALMEINRTYVDSNNKHVIELVKNWGNSNQSNQPAIVIPTTVDFKQAADALKTANTLFNDNTQAMQNWQTKLGTVTFNNIDGTTTTVKTLKQIENEAQAQLEEYHPYPWAMRKVEFEAIRDVNNETFAASGFVHFGKQYNPNIVDNVNEGMYCPANSENTFNLGRYTSNIYGISKTNHPVINLAGVVFHLNGLRGEPNAYAPVTVNLPPAEDGTRTYDSATGVSVTHATAAIAFASETTTNKVVTDRVDMWGFEAFLREINDADPFVYKNGLIQSRASSINGVPTVEDNVRPDTYFAWYEGDTTSTGKGVNWQTATESQRIAMASDPENNIYFDDATGKFYQWCIRGRSFAGLGNADWSSIDIEGGGTLQFSTSTVTSSRVSSQGVTDNDSGFSSVDVFASQFAGGIEFIKKFNDPAIYGLRNTSANQDKAVNGECYFLVCGTVTRLNQGAYHPSFNPQGAAYATDGVNLENRAFWDSPVVNINSRIDTFTNACISVNANGSISTTAANARYPRPDGRFYDAIYAGGQGGVCRDMRYSAWGLTQEDFDAADLAVKSGQYRGRELLQSSVLLDTAPSGSMNIQGFDVGSIFRIYDVNHVSTTYRTNINGAAYLKESDKVIVITQGEHCILEFDSIQDNNYASVFRIASRSAGFNGSLFSNVSDDYYNPSADFLVCNLHRELVSVSSKFNYMEVIATPAKISQCEILKKGWAGTLNTTFPAGAGKSIPFTRPVINNNANEVWVHYTQDNGSSWSTSLLESFTSTHNLAWGVLHGTGIDSNTILIVNYNVGAILTRESHSAPFYGGEKSIGNVFVSSRGREETGRLLGYSFIGKILTSQNASSAGKDHESLPINVLQLGDGLNELIGLNTFVSMHNSINIAPPTSASPAFKTLNYNVVENQQGYINYAYTELTYDATAGDWGDDSKIHIADNQTTMLDENGSTVLVGTARCVEPLGWIKNDK